MWWTLLSSGHLRLSFTRRISLIIDGLRTRRSYFSSKCTILRFFRPTREARTWTIAWCQRRDLKDPTFRSLSVHLSWIWGRALFLRDRITKPVEWWAVRAISNHGARKWRLEGRTTCSRITIVLPRSEAQHMETLWEEVKAISQEETQSTQRAPLCGNPEVNPPTLTFLLANLWIDDSSNQFKSNMLYNGTGNAPPLKQSRMGKSTHLKKSLLKRNSRLM
jgi:hypothetical protein